MNEENVVTVLIVTILAAVVISIIVALMGIHFSDLGQGEHSGYITAIDQRGYIFRNYEVYFKTDNSSSQEDMYCINRNNFKLIEKAKKANTSRKQVTITYHGVRGWGFDLCHTTEIDSIK